MAITVLTDSTFNDFIKNNKVAVVDFYADWCAPCKIIEPHLEELSEELKGKVAFGRIDVDANKENAARFGIMSIPTVIVFRDGRLMDRIVGAYPKEIIKDRIMRIVEM